MARSLSRSISREHRALGNALDAFSERHGEHPAVRALRDHLDATGGGLQSTGGGYNQSRIGQDTEPATPGMRAAQRVREGVTANQGEPRSPSASEDKTTGKVPGQQQRRNVQESDAGSGRRVDRSGQDTPRRGGPNQTGQTGERNSSPSSDGTDGPTQRRRSVDGNTGEGRGEGFNKASLEQARRRFTRG